MESVQHRERERFPTVPPSGSPIEAPFAPLERASPNLPRTTHNQPRCAPLTAGFPASHSGECCPGLATRLLPVRLMAAICAGEIPLLTAWTLERIPESTPFVQRRCLYWNWKCGTSKGHPDPLPRLDGPDWGEAHSLTLISRARRYRLRIPLFRQFSHQFRPHFLCIPLHRARDLARFEAGLLFLENRYSSSRVRSPYQTLIAPWSVLITGSLNAIRHRKSTFSPVHGRYR
jgi:hypothetical protein